MCNCKLMTNNVSDNALVYHIIIYVHDMTLMGSFISVNIFGTIQRVGPTHFWTPSPKSILKRPIVVTNIHQ